jgi:hypothetical protein
MKPTFEPNLLDTRLECVGLAFGELRITLEEVLQPLADATAAVERFLEAWRRPA